MTAYARAQAIRRRLEEKPLAVRTRPNYERALDAYRAVYHGDPGSPAAARSIAAVADLLAAEGRQFHDVKLSRDAVAQWQFLRREYPGSPLRKEARFQQAQIERNDLRERAAAKKTDRAFVAQYPHGALAEQARAGRRGAPVSLHPAKFQPERPTAIADEFSARVRKKFSGAADAPLVAARKAVFERTSPTAVSAAISPVNAQPIATLQSVRSRAEGRSTRVTADMDHTAPYRVYAAPDGRRITLIFFGAHPSRLALLHPISIVRDADLRSIRVSALTGDQAEVVLDLMRPAGISTFVLSNPARVVVDVSGEQAPTQTFSALKAEAPGESPARTAGIRSQGIPRASEKLPPAALIEAVPSASDPQSSMARVLGLRVRRIVIDAGHGGHDSGTLGPGGLEEKDVPLDIAMRLGALLRQRLGADVIYTRRTDRFVPLEERTAIANRANADLFLSIHANSSPDPAVRGVETYYLNFTASPDALQVAARENATSDRSVHELSDLVRKITLSDKIGESREFAADVQQSVYSGLAAGNPGLKNRGVRQAPFAVLIGAHMPSILVEISFLTNPEDADELTSPAYCQRVAGALYLGVARYVNGMSGVRVAKAAQPERVPAPAE